MDDVTSPMDNALMKKRKIIKNTSQQPALTINPNAQASGIGIASCEDGMSPGFAPMPKKKKNK